MEKRRAVATDDRYVRLHYHSHPARRRVSPGGRCQPSSEQPYFVRNADSGAQVLVDGSDHVTHELSATTRCTRTLS
jgi:hypothetical protein